MPTINPRIQAARLLASAGGKAGTGAAKRRSKAHYKRLADIKKLEKQARLVAENGGDNIATTRKLIALRAKIDKLRGK